MRRAYVALVLAMVSWGVSVTVSDAALAALTPADVLFAEIASGTLLVGIVLLVTKRPMSTAPWRGATVLGALEPAGAYLLANLGLARTTASAGSLLLSLESVFAVLLTWLFLRERLRGVEWAALALGLSGAALVALLGGSEAGSAASISGNAFVTLASLVAAGYFLASRRYSRGADPIVLVFKQGLTALVLVLPYTAWSWSTEGSGFAAATPSTWALAVLAGVVGFAIPFTLWSSAANAVRPAVAAIGLNLIPVIGVASAAAFGRGTPTAAQLSGGLLILLGLVLLTRNADAPAGPVAQDAERSPDLVPEPCPVR
jgi:drug/metabolite transporter (DMT)-like permease